MCNHRKIASFLSFRFIPPIVLVCIASLLVSLFSPIDSNSETPITITKYLVFEQSPDREYPNLELEFKKAITVDAFVGNSGHQFYFYAELIIEYDQDLVLMNSTVPLTITLVPYNGPGPEYDLERGLKFNLDYTIHEWGVKYGNDVEGDFVPPLLGDSESYSDMLASIWEKSLWCFGGAEIGIYTVEGFSGNKVKVPLVIEYPGVDHAYFLDSGEGDNDTTLVFTNTDSIILNLRIVTSVDKYVIAADPATDGPEFIIDQTEALINPGFEINIVDPIWWPPDPCNQKTLVKEFFPWIEGSATERDIAINEEEGDSIRWMMDHQSTARGVAGIQDLVLRSYRLASGPPKVGSPDTLVTIIRNKYGDIGRGYEWIDLDYYIHGATAPDRYIPIGSRRLTADSPELASFNNGEDDRIRVEFVYDKSNEHYIFKSDHRWNPRKPVPRYVVKMTSGVSASKESGINWISVPDNPSTGGNNIFKIPFETPAPDFAIDSLKIDCPPYLDPDQNDNIHFDLWVTNKGSDYDGVETVYVVCSRLLLRITDSKGGLEVVDSTGIEEFELGALLSTESWMGSFDYSNTPFAGIFDRALFLFQVNHEMLGSYPDTAVIEHELDLENNTMYTYLNYVSYPDSAYASPVLYNHLDDIDPDLPNIDARFPCNQKVYLYVTKEGMISFDPNYFLVQIGVGDVESCPTDTLVWNWVNCSYKRTIIDNNECTWMVYEAAPCGFTLEEYKYYSYCFRAAISPVYSTTSSLAFPAYMYVDKNGASSAAEEYCEEGETGCEQNKDNSYLYDNSGLIALAPIDEMIWIVEDEYLFQDNFPKESLYDSIRADMATNIGREDTFDPGDSIVVEVHPVSTEASIAVDDNDQAMIYIHVKAHDIGPDEGPVFTGPDLIGADDGWMTIFDVDGEWTILQGDTARTGDPGWRVAAWPKYMFDLNDSLFTAGYMIEYYFSAHDTDGKVAYFPYSAPYDNDYLEFTCLPTGSSDILYVDDYHGILTRDGVVQQYFDFAFKAVLFPLNLPDRYDVNAPKLQISNGLGSRVTYQQLDTAYTTIIWDSGDISDGTLCDGASYINDKSNDCQLLNDWILNAAEGDANLWISGDNIAEELVARGSGPGYDLMNSCGVNLVSGNYHDETDGGYSWVDVEGTGGSPLYSYAFWLDGCRWSETGGCYPLNSFDILDVYGSGQRGLNYLDDYNTYGACIYNSGPTSNGNTYKTMWFGFSFGHIIDNDNLSPSARFQLMYDVFTYFNIESFNSTGDEPPLKNMLSQNYPNPFNPNSKIRFSITRKGFVRLRVYNVSGQLVKTLVNKVMEAGSHTASWDGTNNNGSKVSSGVYFYQLKSPEFTRSRKMVLLR